MTFIMILKIAGIVLGASSISGFITWIVGKVNLRKAIASKQKEIDYLDKRIDFYQKNRQAYDSVVAKLTEKKKNGDKIREDLNSSDSSDLADILNEL